MMDLINKNLLNELIKDSRQSWSSLAKKLNVSLNVLKRKVKELESGVIEGYVTEINSKFFMEGFIFIYLRLSSKKNIDIQRALLRINQLKYLYLIQDITNNFGIFYEFSSLDEKNQLLSFLKNVPFVSNFDIYNFSYTREPLPREIKDVEWKIISLLKNNSRVPGTKLSEVTGLSANKINYIINKLIEDEIILFTVKTNPVKISDKTMYFLLLNMKKFDNDFYKKCLNEVKKFSLFNPPIINFTSPHAFLINLLGEVNEIQNLINNICQSPLISSYSTIVWNNYHMGKNWQDLLIEKKIQSLRIREHFSKNLF
ncbi:MAG: winged helix-turn-helix transcriptional regulator [Candidatus Lokiarchaeota archaeon]|nr:winged helix-turn-helix transcriptional regulator [Candidatus Lokiarchaeota archaeon]